MTIESSTPDPYAVLGVSSDASEAKVRKAWRNKTKAAGPGSAEFRALNDAAELLLDPDRRKIYDGQVAAQRVAAAEEAKAAESPADDSEPEAVVVAEPAAEPAAAESSTLKQAFTGWTGTAVLAGFLAVIAIALAIWQGLDNGSGTSPSTAGPGTGGVAPGAFAGSQSDQQAVLSAVQSGLPAVLSYNYASMPASQANAERFLTAKARPGLEASYQRLISGGTPPGCKSALPPIATRKTVVTATVVSAGIVSVNDNAAQIGVFVNQTTTAAGQTSVTTQNRVLVSLVKQNGNWLIDSMSVPNTDHVLNC